MVSEGLGSTRCGIELAHSLECSLDIDNFSVESFIAVRRRSRTTAIAGAQDMVNRHEDFVKPKNVLTGHVVVDMA
jgi:NADH:ubiquinone oxidoreductase subunit B-like Fe-S oxidoreductase